ncbi:hypothetical protein B0T18DRAFT_424063 [Schizothecium vesticola]|uniref:Peptidase S8/S53 domain-containing protein n=1 Tax=Schizothecium vesticola TaxID=314040 RepID=A0AA40F957_9PEZI|nr:hypothetical protein B0T18DRAFT_424063 [Schizothecium vesticola]
MADHRARARAPGSPDVTVFAISSIDRVRKIAQAIIVSGDKAATPFCRNLRSALDGVKTELERPKPSQDEAQLEKAKSLLKNLERLCNEAAEVAQNNEASATAPAPHKSHELDEDIESLFKVLNQYRLCQDDSSPGEIVANLRLNGYRTLAAGGASVEFMVENASAEFGVLFLDHPHENRGFWQEASIQTCPTVSPPDREIPTILFARPDLYLLDKSKAILAMLAANATWQFYDSELLAQGLTSESLQFICEKRFGRTGGFINEPMLLTRYTKKYGTSTGDETRKTMKEHRENPRLCPPGPFGINTDYKIACKLVATGPDASESIIPDIEPLSPLKKILPLCITPGSLERKLRENLSSRGLAKSASKANQQNALRSVIYSELVRPLEDWANRYDNFDRTKPLYEVSDAPAGPRPERLPNQPQTASQATHQADVAEDNKLRDDSRKWFERYIELRNVLQPRSDEMKSGYKAVKIAVLDTGIRQDLYNHYKAYPDALEYEDFVDTARLEKDTTSDGTGHGVLKTNVATRTDVDLIVKGIDWAISQKVDIITMAIGFKEEQGPVVQAVDRAHKQGILIFSAASNERKFDDVYCPANVTDQVFGVFSTDAGICESRSLNPAPLPESFAVFGEGVEVEEGHPLRRGTSYSTSVAAGLAAALLDFSRQDRAEDDRSILSRLGSRPHMQGLFREMAVADNGYLCLRPWSLLKSEDTLAMAPKEAARKQQRVWIRGTIERLLQPKTLRRAGRC